MADFLSHTKHVFSGPIKGIYDENSKPSAVGRTLHNVQSVPPFRRSIDNGDLAKGKGDIATSSVYRI